MGSESQRNFSLKVSGCLVSSLKMGIFGSFSFNIDTHAGFVHLHVHTQYSILDGQASIPRLVDKAMANGMRGIAVTDHGDMFGIKEFFNYVNKKNGGTNGEIKDLKKKIAALESGKEESETPKRRLQLARNSWRLRKEAVQTNFRL